MDRASGRKQAEAHERRNELAARRHLRRVSPRPRELGDRRPGTQPTQPVREPLRLVPGGHDAVGRAPPELERHAGPRNRLRVPERAPASVRPRVARWRAADLLARMVADHDADSPVRSLATAVVAGKPDEVAVPTGHVGDRVERGGSREQPRVAGDQEQRLLPAHAGAERVDARAVDRQPRQRAADRPRHAGEILDLTRVSPGEALQAPALSLGADDRERSAGRQVPPAPDVRGGADPTPVRGDDEGQRWVVLGAVPVREHDVRRPPKTVVRAVVDRPDPDSDVVPGGSTRGRPHQPDTCADDEQRREVAQRAEPHAGMMSARTRRPTEEGEPAVAAARRHRHAERCTGDVRVVRLKERVPSRSTSCRTGGRPERARSSGSPRP